MDFPEIKKGIDRLIEDEEGSVPGKKLLVLGTLVLILGSLLPFDSLARGHRSHQSHRSHSSHRNNGHVSHTSHSSHSSHASHSNHSNHGSHTSHDSHTSHSNHSNHDSHASHSNHSNHASHSNHSNHASHTSHSNTASHSNSRYSSEGDVTYAPAVSTIKGVAVPTVETTEELFKLPVVNANIESPNGTPGTGIIPNLSVPSSTMATKIDIADINKPPATDKVE